MSHQNFNLQWKEGINQLMDIIQVENLPKEQNEQNVNYKRSDHEWFQHFAILYIKYVQTYKILENCYDQIVHPQKRMLLKEMLDMNIMRMIQCYQEMVRFNTHHDQVRCEFVNLESILMDLKLSPDILEVKIPKYFLEQEKERRDERNQLIDKQLLQFQETCEPEEEVIQDRSKLDANLTTAIRIIQKNERGRQAIERIIEIKYKMKEQKKEEEKKLKMRLAQGQEINEESEKEEALTTIQKYFRGFKAREQVFQMRKEEQEFLGMKLEDKEYDKGEDPKDLEVIQRKKMKQIQNENYEEYQKALDDIKELVKINEGPDIKQNMLDNRREWVKDYIAMYQYKKVPKVEEYYERKDVQMPLTPEQVEQQRAELEQKAKEAKKAKDSKKGKGKGKGKKSDLDEFLDGRNLLQPSEQVIKMQEKIEQYNQDWCNKDDSKNFNQKHETNMAQKKIMPDVNTEIEQIVDRMIQVEIQSIKTELGIKQKDKKKKKKGKKKKGKKGKKIPGQNLVKNRVPKDLLSELVEANVVKKLLPAQIDDLIGDANMLGYIQEQTSKYMPDPSMAQLRQYITNFLGMGLGNSEAKKTIPKSNYVLFYGPMGTGKSLMVRALATQCDAMVIDLSVSNIEGNYTDRSSTNKLLYMAFTVAKEFQPAIIFMDDTDMVFPKKKKSTGPARVKKPLTDFKKAKYIKEDDRVLFIGLTNKPQEGNMKEMRTFFEKKIYFPFPNYGTRMMLFKHFLNKKGVTLQDNFPISSIAHITEGYSGRSFEMAINQVLTKMRIQKLKERPLSFNEFIGPLSNTFSTFAQEYEKIREFTDDITELKQRREKKKNPNQEEAPKKGKKGKKGK